MKISRLIGKILGCFGAIFLFLGVVSAYSECYTITHTGNEYRAYYGGFHFMSVIYDGNAIIIRPHPGLDANGWGASVYWSPYSSEGIIKFTNTPTVLADCSGITLSVSGSVTKNESSSYGSWSMNSSYIYDSVNKKISGNGIYSITLDGPLSVMGDMSLIKIATNYLENVPLLSGGIGNTGDMKQVNVVGNLDYPNFSYVPPDASGEDCHFPWDFTDYLSMSIIGQYNEVDVVVLGDCPISPAYKPSVKVQLTSTHADEQMIFGVCYQGDKSKDFEADNVGVGPLIIASSDYTQYDFTFNFESEAIAGDGQNVPDIQTPKTCYDFGTVGTGQGNLNPITFTFYNTGLADLEIGALNFTGTDYAQFLLRNDYCSGTTLAPNTTCTADVLLWTSSDGHKEAHLEIPSNDPDENSLVILLEGTAQGPTLVDLLSFDAKKENKKIILTWETGTEMNTSGFNIMKKTSNGIYKKINKKLIVAKGDDIKGESYEFTDAKVKTGVKYSYKLVEVDLAGKKKTLAVSEKIKI